MDELGGVVRCVCVLSERFHASTSEFWTVCSTPHESKRDTPFTGRSRVVEMRFLEESCGVVQMVETTSFSEQLSKIDGSDLLKVIFLLSRGESQARSVK